NSFIEHGGEELHTRDIARLTQTELLAGGPVLQPAGIRAALLVAYAAENPRLTRLPGWFERFDNRAGAIDCVSCHVQGPALIRFENDPEMQQKFMTPELVADIKRVRYEGDLFDSLSHRDTVINFGFVGLAPSI